MNKLVTFIIALALIILSSCSSKASNIKDEAQGVWTNDTINITFTSDTIYIDEIGNEGFGYTYTFQENTNTFVLSNDFDTFDIIVTKVTKDSLTYKIKEDRTGREYILHKTEKNEYN